MAETGFNSGATLQGASGLDLSAGGDRVKIVYAGPGSLAAACNMGSGVAQGTTLTSSMPLTDLPGSDSTEATEVVLSEVVFEEADRYVVCYQLKGGSYEAVGQELEISSVAPTT